MVSESRTESADNSPWWSSHDMLWLDPCQADKDPSGQELRGTGGYIGAVSCLTSLEFRLLIPVIINLTMLKMIIFMDSEMIQEL